MKKSVLFFGLWVFFLSGCDNTIQPYIQNAPIRVSVYGYLDTARDTQFVRVTALKRADGRGLYEVGGVKTIVKSTGQTLVWRDSLITATNGEKEHLFYAIFRAQAGESYTLKVTDTTGYEASAETTIPTTPLVSVQSPARDVGLGWIQRVLVQTSILPYRAKVWYRAAKDDTTPPAAFRFDYHTAGELNAGQWNVPIKLQNDCFRVADMLNISNGLRIYGISVEGVQLDAQWEQRLRKPNMPLQNVANGIGFWGSQNRYVVTWKIPPETLRQMGHIDRQSL
ncbi:MAG: DUF4249 family protein [Bacteroidetes Order II. Incertae sedis bacterium]|nr:DUF4249 family protein [Bacteroidetes Order II. bacterium]